MMPVGGCVHGFLCDLDNFHGLNARINSDYELVHHVRQCFTGTNRCKVPESQGDI